MLKKETIIMKKEIISIIEQGRLSGLGSEIIVNTIFNEVIFDKSIVVVEGKKERPLKIQEIIFVVQKALEQAEFEGAAVLLSSGERIKKR